ncbi:hypothetical protein A9Q99_08435 [Gammaproteobacteria bacterium 45_16_T64]|nr:hypothetical protein A9Q99_08435 [Gammaproteobacteria bacterium 45_16_T64]
MATITAGGLGSGIDVDLLVSTLTAAEEEPVKNRLDFREIQVQADISAYTSLKGALSSFQSALSGLTSLADFSTRTATSSSESVFTATASNAGVPSTTDIEVTALASSQKMVSDDYETTSTAIGAGDVTLTIGSDSFTVSIVGGSNNTLTGLRDAINDASDNVGISASILTVDDPVTPGQTVSKLVLNSDKTGEDNAFTITVANDADGDDTDDSGISKFINANLNSIDTATDASITVDGFTATSSTNVFTGVIAGVTLSAVSADPGNTHTLTVASDVSDVSDKISSFVDAFNSFESTYKFLTAVDIEKKEAGLLTGDATVRSLETQIRRVLQSEVGDTTNDTYTSLARIGITVGEEGELVLDQTVLSTALNEEFDEVAELIAGTGGIATQMDGVHDEFLKSGGIIPTREATFQSQLVDIADQRVSLALRLESVEARIRKQFSAMDIIVAQFNSTGDFIKQQFDALNAGRD